MNRRGFLFGLGATLAAPMVVKAEILMPVKKVIMKPEYVIWKNSIYKKVLEGRSTITITEMDLSQRIVAANGKSLVVTDLVRAMGPSLVRHIDRESFMDLYNGKS